MAVHAVKMAQGFRIAAALRSRKRDIRRRETVVKDVPRSAGKATVAVCPARHAGTLKGSRGANEPDGSFAPQVERSKHENGGARGFSRLQVSMCLDRVLQLIPLIDLDADPACRDMAE